MGVARYLVEAHVREGRAVSELARSHGVHRSWIYKLLARYRAEGEAGLEPRPRRPRRSPTKTSAGWVAEILALRGKLTGDGFDAGAQTIHAHLCREHPDVPSPSTIWRVLKAAGLVTPQPHKRPRSSYVRFCAELPNECWQTDITCWREVEIMGVIDDHSRLCVTANAFVRVTVADVVSTFYKGAERYGLPASLLSDNGAVYTAAPRGGRCAIESELIALGIVYKHSRPYHPQTCGKIERFHQTLKKHLAAQTPVDSLAQLQTQIDRFVAYYNEVRPHRALARRAPAAVYAARTKAAPHGNDHPPARHYRVRHDNVDASGTVTLRYRSRLHHIGLGRAHKGQRVLVLIADRDVRVLTIDGEILRQLELDPSRDYQPLG
ncbi:MAG TPA: IS481 family transposase [Solirubrobacteraceae bacterium]|nr:IS481 family transposase [Solirubrobacteraceae bacterium]